MQLIDMAETVHTDLELGIGAPRDLSVARIPAKVHRQHGESTVGYPSAAWASM